MISFEQISRFNKNRLEALKLLAEELRAAIHEFEEKKNKTKKNNNCFVKSKTILIHGSFFHRSVKMHRFATLLSLFESLTENTHFIFMTYLWSVSIRAEKLAKELVSF